MMSRTCTRAPRRRQAACLRTAPCLMLAACMPHPAQPPRVMTPSQVQQELLVHVQHLGDLSHYIMDSQDSPGKILVLVPGTRNDACVPTQKPTSLKQPLNPDDVHRVTAAIEAMNQAFELKQEPRFEPYTLRYECSGRGPGAMAPLGLDEIRARMTDELVRLAELSGYIESAEPGLPIKVWQFDPASRSCGPGQANFPARQALAKNLLSKAEHAIDNINADLAARRDLQITATVPDRSCAANRAH